MADLEIYKKAGVDSIIFENDHDLPYIQPPLNKKGIRLMTKICKKARKRFNGPIGVQMLEAANIESLEIAAEAGLDYIRVEAFFLLTSAEVASLTVRLERYYEEEKS